MENGEPVAATLDNQSAVEIVKKHTTAVDCYRLSIQGNFKPFEKRGGGRNSVNREVSLQALFRNNKHTDDGALVILLKFHPVKFYSMMR